MPDHLRFTWITDGDGNGQIIAEAAARGWAGTADGWLADRTVRAFASDLRRYPLDPEAPPRLLTGFGPNGRGEGGFQATIDLSLIVIGSRGRLAADIHLSTFVWPEDPIQIGSSGRIVLPTSYQQVAQFADAIDALLDGRSEEAVLLGETFS